MLSRGILNQRPFCLIDQGIVCPVSEGGRLTTRTSGAGAWDTAVSTLATGLTMICQFGGAGNGAIGLSDQPRSAATLYATAFAWILDSSQSSTSAYSTPHVSDGAPGSDLFMVRINPGVDAKFYRFVSGAWALKDTIGTAATGPFHAHICLYQSGAKSRLIYLGP